MFEKLKRYSLITILTVTCLSMGFVAGVALTIRGVLALESGDIGRMHTNKCYRDNQIVFKPQVYAKAYGSKSGWTSINVQLHGNLSVYNRIAIQGDVYEVPCE